MILSDQTAVRLATAVFARMMVGDSFCIFLVSEDTATLHAVSYYSIVVLVFSVGPSSLIRPLAVVFRLLSLWRAVVNALGLCLITLLHCDLRVFFVARWETFSPVYIRRHMCILTILTCVSETGINDADSFWRIRRNDHGRSLSTFPRFFGVFLGRWGALMSVLCTNFTFCTQFFIRWIFRAEQTI